MSWFSFEGKPAIAGRLRGGVEGPLSAARRLRASHTAAALYAIAPIFLVRIPTFFP